MTLKEFNKKYENIKRDYPDIFKITRSTKIVLPEDYNIEKLIIEYKASNIDLEKLINFQKQLINDWKQIKGE
ncbi:hypothetical protein [Spiroplasma endosymbiont of Amphimallon solstitiale]|uniref:hypothetical protein n=1 Tax=Spiroplasma endosymbiont of Amphimallon solstitiale TaxID=3066288 RepID=UPI00313AEDAB